MSSMLLCLFGKHAAHVIDLDYKKIEQTLFNHMHELVHT